MNWSNRVILILSVFLTGMISMVYISMRQTNEVVDANYYERELKYQQVIDGQKNLVALADPVVIRNEDAVIKITLPFSSVNQLDSGYIQFLKLSDSKKDRLIPMRMIDTGHYEVARDTFAKGWYKVHMNWANNGQPYYHEQNFNVQ